MANRKRGAFDNLLEMFKEAGVYSLNRVVPATLIYFSFVLFLALTIFLIIHQPQPLTWSHYSDFCTVFIALVVACGSWITGNKITNSKYNTSIGEPGKPMGDRIAQVVDSIAKTVNEHEKAEERK